MSLTREEVRARALSQLYAVPVPPLGAPKDAGNRPIGYRLKGGFNGGFDPTANHCASWSFGGRAPTADCIGFVLWASGIDREQPTYKGSRDEWLNCASLLDDAHNSDLPNATKPRRFCRPLAAGEAPKVSDWLMDRGHISLIIRVPTFELPELVIDCSPRHDPSRKAAIGVGYAWSHDCEIIRPLFYKDV